MGLHGNGRVVSMPCFFVSWIAILVGIVGVGFLGSRFGQGVLVSFGGVISSCCVLLALGTVGRKKVYLPY